MCLHKICLSISVFFQVTFNTLQIHPFTNSLTHSFPSSITSVHLPVSVSLSVPPSLSTEDQLDDLEE